MELKEHLTEDIDFALVPEPVWNLLVKWYQLTPGQEPIARKVLFFYFFPSSLHINLITNIACCLFLIFLGCRPWNVDQLSTGRNLFDGA